MRQHLLVIGGQRCGTTYLYGTLDAHPEIAMARPARPEPKVFLDDTAAALGADCYRDTYFPHAAGASVLGEKSTSYLEHGVAAERAARCLEGAAVVVLLRDPVARAVSNWRFSTAHGLEERPLAQALRENLRGPRPWDPIVTSVSPYAYVERGHYVDYLQPWLRAFPSSVHVRFTEEFVGCATAVRALYTTLGVDDTFLPPALTGTVNAGTGPAPDLSPGLNDALRAAYAGSDARLRALLGRPLPWDDR